MNSSLPSSLHFIKNIPYQLKIYPAIVLFLISISSPKFLIALFIIVSIVILPLPSLSPFQSAYRKFHSAETALLRIYNDLLVSISQHKLSALVLLDLSAATPLTYLFSNSPVSYHLYADDTQLYISFSSSDSPSHLSILSSTLD